MGKSGIASGGITANGRKSSSSPAASPYSSPISSPTSTRRASGGGGGGSSDGSWLPEDDFGVALLTPRGLWRSVCAEVSARFRHRLVVWGPEGEANEVGAVRCGGVSLSF